ncbi:MAG: helicase-related protein [Sedimentisphaerales bacterium]
MAGAKRTQNKDVHADTVGLRSRSWERFLKGPDTSLLEDLYVPALKEALRYDRCCSYFSSSVLAVAARGFAGLIERLESLGENAPKPAVRLVVNEVLAREDVDAMLESGDTKALEEALRKRFKTPKDILEKQRLSMLAWLVKKGLLAVRVGVMRRGEGIVHGKFGVIIDGASDSVVFSGSGNESASGLMANYENLEVSTSWEDPNRYKHYSEEFELLWRDAHPEVHTVSLPEAMRLRLIKFAPPEAPTAEPSNAVARQKAAMVWRYIAEAQFIDKGYLACDATAIVNLWPHQKRVVSETASAWPGGRLLCDEVGMGKTIEAICALRRLLAGRGVRRALFLLPAAIVRQWQSELREKGGIIVPRLETQTSLVWPDDRVERVADLAEALKTDVLLMSRETARTENNLPFILAAEPWDLVVLDESHAARRKRQVEGEFNSGTLLLSLLRQLQLKGKARGFLLLSATPMQTHPWEPWDLLTLLGEGGAWIAEFDDIRKYYGVIAALGKGRCDNRSARKAAELLVSDPDVPALPGEKGPTLDPKILAWNLETVPIRQRDEIVRWMRCASPLGRRMHRNTRETLQEYFRLGMIEAPPPGRSIEDKVFDYMEGAERRVYESIKRYIDKRFAELEAENSGKGFVMTVYRRRATSSPQALERSLKRRLSGLKRVIERKAYDTEVGEDEKINARDLDDAGRTEEKISAALPTDPRIAKSEAEEVQRLLNDLQLLHGIDSKRDQFYEVIRRVVDDGRAVLIFSEYVDTMEYIRDNLRDFFDHSLGCYSGEGGQVWDGKEWKRVTKDLITDKLQQGEIKALVCTDAASEGLNLQAAGAVINYDLPWNPSKVEQRIGRIDRIGQKLDKIKIINFFLKDSIDERVYKVLRERCGLFEHFVGAMQPVLSKARAILLGEDGFDVDTLEGQASEAEQDFFAYETYISSRAALQEPEPIPPLNKEELKNALTYLREEIGFKVVQDTAGKILRIKGSDSSGFRCSLDISALEADPKLLPLNPAGKISEWVVGSLSRSGENLPLVVASYLEGRFRSSEVRWIHGKSVQKCENFQELEKKLASWDGNYPDPKIWLKAQEAASRVARKHVKAMIARAQEIEQKGKRLQAEAARLRLLKELGRFLVCVEEEVGDLNRVLFRQLKRDLATALRLEKCLEKLGGYPEWSEFLLEELREFLDTLTPNDRNARLLGSQLDAALDDPRWQALV